MPEPLIVIPSYIANVEDLDVHLRTVQTLADVEPDVEVLLVDDCSPAPELVDMLTREAPDSCRVIRCPTNEGFSTTVNVGLGMALDQGRDAILVNADMEFERPFVAAMQATEAEIVGGLLLYPNGLIQHAGIFFSLLHRTFDHIYRYAPGNLPEALRERTCPVTGALQYIPHTTLATVGLYDERFRLGWEDVDYCIRTFIAGGKCVMQPAVQVVHFESMFRSRPSPKLVDWQARSWLWFIEKYREQSFAEWVPSLI